LSSSKRKCLIFLKFPCYFDSSVYIVTKLRGGRSGFESRWGAKSCSPLKEVQNMSAGRHISIFCTHLKIFPGINWPGPEANHSRLVSRLRHLNPSKCNHHLWRPPSYATQSFNRTIWSYLKPLLSLAHCAVLLTFMKLGVHRKLARALCEQLEGRGSFRHENYISSSRRFLTLSLSLQASLT
jgi:hypothetical protein